MKTFYLLKFCIMLLIPMVSICEAENWYKYFSNNAGYDFFIEKDSIVRLDKNIVQVWYKSCPSQGKNGAWNEWLELRLLDCKRKRYKVLQGAVYSKEKIEKLTEESTWTYSEPGALYDNFLKAVCESLK